jgi:secreted trypsin-like serine protease
VGRTDLTKTDEGDQIGVKMMISHPEFDFNGTWENDFALLILTRPTTATNVHRMLLNTDENYPEPDTIGTAMGWGDVKEQSDKYEGSDVLMTVEANTLSNEECASAHGKLDGFDGSYKDWIYPSMICTLSNKQNACKGDSGKVSLSSFA